MTVHLQRLPLNVDPLIDEARQRMHRRRLLIAVLAEVAVLALGLTFALHPFRSDSVATPRAWVPAGVHEIDIRGFSRPPAARKFAAVSFRVTDPAEVKSVVAWFDGLERNPRTVTIHGRQLVCAGGPAESVAFTFRGANGRALARAFSAPGVAEYCDPIQLTAGTHRASFLVDANRASSLIGRVQGLLGVTFASTGYYG
jgi:hypothetical protein